MTQVTLRRRRRNPQGSARDFILPALVGVAVAGAAVAAYASRAAPVDPATDCPAEGPPPSSTVLAVDTSDPNLGGQRAMLRELLGNAIDEASEHGRVTLVEIRGAPTAELHPLLSRCVPRLNSNRARHRFHDLMQQPLADKLDKLEGRPADRRSPVLETTFMIGRLQSLRDASGRITIVLVTDGMQNTENLSFYRRGATNSLVARPLRNVSVTIVPLRNERDLARQPAAFERLASIMRDAGARVSYERPAWLSFQEARR